jgi:hypothetical protein
VSEAVKAALETIRVEFFDAQFSGEQRDIKVGAVAAASVSGVNKAVAHIAKTSSATASGAQLSKAAAGSSYASNIYNRMHKISETIIRYGTKSQLQIRRVIDRDEEEDAPAVARPRAKKENARAPPEPAAGAGPGGGAAVGAGEAEAKRVKREKAVAANNAGPTDLTGGGASDAGGVISLDD